MLVISPLGDTERRDTDGSMVGTFKPQPSSPSVIVPQQEGKKQPEQTTVAASFFPHRAKQEEPFRQSEGLFLYLASEDKSA